MKKIGPTTRALMAATIVLGLNTAGLATVFADTNSTTNAAGAVNVTVTGNTSVAPDTQSSSASNAALSSTASTGTTATSVNGDAAGSTNPGLIPGDFFYFIKTSIENIRLMLTFNDVNKASLLAQYAQQRIAEANALIAGGNPSLAESTLQQATQDENQALELAVKTGSSTIDFNSTNNAVSNSANNVPSSNPVANQPLNSSTTPSNDGNSTTNTSNSTTDSNSTANPSNTNDTSSVNAANQSSNTNATNNGTLPNGDDNSELKPGGKRDQVLLHVGQNAIALTNALSHVKNPKAQSAIERNIEKSLTHLESQLQQLAAATMASNLSTLGNSTTLPANNTTTANNTATVNNTATASTPTVTVVGQSTNSTADTNNTNTVGSTVTANATVAASPVAPPTKDKADKDGNDEQGEQGDGNKALKAFATMKNGSSSSKFANNHQPAVVNGSNATASANAALQTVLSDLQQVQQQLATGDKDNEQEKSAAAVTSGSATHKDDQSSQRGDKGHQQGQSQGHDGHGHSGH